MKKIYLFCSAGMSTSMLAQEMQNVADAHGLPLEVKAYSHSKICLLYTSGGPVQQRTFCIRM